MLKAQHKRKSHLAEYSNFNTQLNRNTNVILIAKLYDMLTIATLSGTRKEYVGLSSSSLLLSSKLFLSVVQQLYSVRLSHVYTPPILVWLTQEDIPTLLINSWPKIYTTS